MAKVATNDSTPPAPEAEVATNGSTAPAPEAEVATKGSTAPAPDAEATVAAVFTGLKMQLTVAAGRAEEAVMFYKAAFAAVEVTCSTHSKRKGDGEEAALLCAELNVSSTAMLVRDQDGDGVPVVAAGAGGIVLHLEADDVKAAAAQVAGAGATLQGQISEDGDGLCATLVDPFGITWVLASTTSAKKCA